MLNRIMCEKHPERFHLSEISHNRVIIESGKQRQMFSGKRGSVLVIAGEDF